MNEFGFIPDEQVAEGSEFGFVPDEPQTFQPGADLPQGFFDKVLSSYETLYRKPLENVAKGVGKGIGSTIMGMSEIGQDVLQKTAGRVVEAVTGKKKETLGTPLYETGTEENIQVKERLAPEGVAQNIGFYGEKLAEFLAPNKLITGANKILNTAVEGTNVVKGIRATTAAAKMAESSPGFMNTIARGVTELTKVGLHTIPEATSAYVVSRLQGESDEQAKENAKWAAGITAGLGVASLGAETAGNMFKQAARKLYRSGMKPSTAAGAPKAEQVVETGLKEAIRLTDGGVQKTANTIDDLEAKLGEVIKKSADSNGMIKTEDLIPFVDDAKNILGETVDVSGSIKSIETIDDMYFNFAKKYGEEVPVEVAQKLKTNTYQILKNSYGELSNATREGMKALTRGLKEGIVDVAPEAGNINARLKALYQFDEALQKSTGRIKNLNLLGLGTKMLVTSDNRIVQLMSAANELLGSPVSKSGGAIYLYRLGNMLQRLAPSEITNFTASPTGKKVLQRITGQTLEELSPEERAIAQKITDYMNNPKIGLSIEDVSQTNSDDLAKSTMIPSQMNAQTGEAASNMRNISQPNIPSLTDKTGKMSSPKGEGAIPDQLLEEAKKYKSAEEFVKARGQSVFRGGDTAIDVSRGGGRGISVSDKETAGLFTPPKGGVVDEAILPKTAKILKEGDIPKNLQDAYIKEAKVLADPNNFSSTLQKSVIEKQQAIVEYARKNGFDAVEFPFEKEIRIIKPNVLQTKSQLTDIWNKAQGASLPYKETGDLSTKLLGKLEGRTTVSKQFISDLTNAPDLKQAEKDIIRQALETEGATIDVPKFAEKVKAELLPLKVENKGATGTRYENIALPSELRGNVKNYKENVYESPIKTSAGDTHFSGSPYGGGVKNYFGHTRIEDMADNQTRRVIEVQSDLYQKGRLEGETPAAELNLLQDGRDAGMPDSKIEPMLGQKISDLEKRQTEIAKLSQYNDPTAHFRMVREEVKKAAQDGKTKLQFPTGETAMKIEGLGQGENRWFDVNYGTKVDATSMKVGDEITHTNQFETNDVGSHWIITDVLGDGKFKAVPKRAYESHRKPPKFSEIADADKETFDISGKVDTSNPIYRFYEKDLGRYLKSKYNAQLVTDARGIKWYEVPIKKEWAKMPVEAFGAVPLIINPNGDTQK